MLWEPRNNEILKYNPGEKSLKIPFIIYADLECKLRKMNACQVNLTKSYTEKKAEHELVHLINQKLNVIIIENKTVKIFCRDLRDSAMKIIMKRKT